MLFKLSIKQLFDSKTHIGYSKESYFKILRSHIIGLRTDFFILKIVKSLTNLKLALWFSFYLAVYSNKILFIYHAPTSFMYVFGLVFRVLGHFSLKTKWRAGTLTNFRRIRKHYRYLYTKYIKDFNIYKSLTFFTYYNKKLAPQISDFLFIRRLPSFVLILSVFNSDIAAKESFVVRIPSMGFVSNRSFPFGLTFPVISNDVSEESFVFYLLLYKNLIFKAIFCRKMGFFEFVNKNVYLQSKNRKITKLQFQKPFTVLKTSRILNENFFLFIFQLNKYRKKNKKIRNKMFAKYRKKKFFNFRKRKFLFRKERKKALLLISNLFYFSKFGFFDRPVFFKKYFSLFRKNFFLDLFFKKFSAKKYKYFRLKKRYTYVSKISKKQNEKNKKKERTKKKIFFTSFAS